MSISPGSRPSVCANGRNRPPSSNEVEASGIATLEWVLERLPRPFDVVASTCVLTQLAFMLRDALGEHHKMLGAVRLSMVLTHLRCLVGLTAPGGVSVFACDLASSNHFPLDHVAAGCVFDRRDGPDHREGSVLRVGESESDFAALGAGLSPTSYTAEPELLDPWLWTGPESRTYMVYAIRALRRSTET